LGCGAYQRRSRCEPARGDRTPSVAVGRTRIEAKQQRAEGPRVWSHEQGIRVTGADGHEAIDANSGLWWVAAGYGWLEIAEAMAEQARRLPFDVVA